MSGTHEALVPELQRELEQAARRRHAASAARSPEGGRRRRSLLRAGRRTPLLAAALLVVLCAAAALAATTLLSGAPVRLPSGLPLTPRSGLGLPSSAHAAPIALQTPDPAGGPAWGARLVSTTRGYDCLQIGRVDDGELGVIGSDGAFADDGRFHQLPPDYLEGPFPCAPADRAGHAFGGVFIQGAPASAMLGRETCTAPGKPQAAGQPPRCPSADERLVMAGMAGPQAVSVTFADGHGRLHTVPTAGPDGIYLIVQRAPRLGVEAGEYQPLGGAGGGTIRAVTYRDGHVCRLAPHEPFSSFTQGTCPAVGAEPLPGPRLSAAQLATPISVVARMQRVRLRYRDVRMRMLDISFRAPVAVTNASSEYRVIVRYPGHAANCGIVSVAPVFADVRRGQLVHQQVAEDGCRGRFRVTVLYVYGGRSSGLPGELRGPTMTIGRRTLEVR